MIVYILDLASILGKVYKATEYMKYIITALIIGFSFMASAQDDAFPKNEIKVNAVNLILLNVYAATYERLLNEESGLGATFAYIGGSSDANLTISPFYRLYFGKKHPAAGFFVEGGLLFAGYDNGDKLGVATAVNMAVGVKLLSKKDFVFEGLIGVGRLIGVEGIFSSSGFVYPRLGINIGK